MSALSAAVRAECCNFSAGGCLLRGDQACVVLAGGRCDWFEEAVLPLADRPSPKADPHRQPRLQAARTSYWKTRRSKSGRHKAREGP